jgi:ArsR family transcriptional regulator
MCECDFHYTRLVPDSLRQFKTEIFQALANPTRIAILDELRDGELTVSTIVRRLHVDQSNASQHLAILRARQIVFARKAGSQVYYAIRDPLIFQILDLMRRYFQNQVSESIDLLEESERTPRRKSPAQR